eukprot:1451929-Rhodomonas_salina.1
MKLISTHTTSVEFATSRLLAGDRRPRVNECLFRISSHRGTGTPSKEAAPPAPLSPRRPFLFRVRSPVSASGM